MSTAYAANINAVQSGTATSSGTGTVSVPLTPAVNPAQSFLIFQSRHNLNRPPGSMIRGTINGAGTAVDFTRVTNETSTMEIQWYVAEFTSGVSVQRGQINQTAATINIGAAQGMILLLLLDVILQHIPTPSPQHDIPNLKTLCNMLTPQIPAGYP